MCSTGMPTKEDGSSPTTTPITRIKSIIPNSKSKNNLFMTFFDNTDPIVRSSSQYIITQTREDLYNENYWSLMIPSAAYFHVYNSVLGDVFAMVYNNNIRNEKNHSLSTFIISKHGCSVHPEIYLSADSKYYPAVENLNPSLKSSKVRKALAISLLKTFADLNSDITDSLYSQADLPNKTFDWDETQAGLLASQMTLLDALPPSDIGSYLYELGYLTQSLSTASYVVDVIYTDQPGNELLSEQNNALAFLLGKQLEQLFDPLTEYSPEPTEKVYKPPIDNFSSCMEEDNDLICSICSELITVQTNYTVSLVQFLQNFIVPLRIKVLEGKLPGYSTAKLNQIFPPTIDEVTRINCIFLDMLKLARPYGSYEILKACGTTIPYFYKAQMRHEAATKNFHSNYLKFVADVNTSDCSDLLSLDQPTVETAVYSSLNLVKIQLIIQRLVKNQTWPDQLKDSVNIYLDSCDDTISSFANDKLLPYNGRIFTPTGKILAEIAKGWPSELQFGWLTRRVVAVFDATDILANNVRNKSVIIVFSDHALFLTIDDDEYYADLWRGNESQDTNNGKNKIANTELSASMSNSDYVSSSIHKPSVSDILMHSLTNETPLNKLPHMSVKYWASINDLHALHFVSSAQSADNTPNSYVRFFNEKDSSFTGIYQLDKVSGKYVTEVLARSKILNKTQSFHLFCGSISNDDLKPTENSDDSENQNGTITKRVYYTAHEASTYEKEDTKSPFIVLFNKEYNDDILDEYNVYAFITLNFVKDDTIRMEGISRCRIDGHEKEKLSYDVNVDILSASLSLILSELFSTHMSLYNPMLIDYLLANNGQVNSQASKVLNVPLEVLDSDRTKIIDSVMKSKKERDIVNSVANDKKDRRKSLELLSEDIKTKKLTKALQKKEVKENKEVRFQAAPTMKDQSKTSNNPPRNLEKSSKGGKAKSGFFKFFSRQKPSNKTPAIDKQLKRNATVVYQKKDSTQKNYDYSELKPAKPKIQKKKSSQSFTLFSLKSNNLSVAKREAKVQPVKKEVSKPIISKPNNFESSIANPISPQKIVDNNATSVLEKEDTAEMGHRLTNSQTDNTTLSTGIYVNSHFEFPMESAPASQNLYQNVDNDKSSAPVTPRIAKLKDGPGHTKGYKDSVDLMGKLNIQIEDPKVYDDDLFELSSNNVSKTLQQSHEQFNIVKPKSIHSETTQTDDTNVFTPKAYDFTPVTQISSRNPAEVKDSDYVDEKFYNNNIAIKTDQQNKNIIIDANVKRNPWRVMTLPVKSPEVDPDMISLQRSKSFYTRFKNMRERQEQMLKENGMTLVRDLSDLPIKDRKALSQGFIFSPSICSNLDKSILDNENTNWTSMDNIMQSTSTETDLPAIAKLAPQKPPNLTTKPLISSPSTSISVVERKIVQTKPIVKESRENSRSISTSSSVYLTSEDDALKTYDNLQSALNAINPYSMVIDDTNHSSILPDIYEDELKEVSSYHVIDDNDDATILHTPVYHSESVSNVKLYQDDIDFFSDLDLDKMDLNIDMNFPDVSELLINSVNIKQKPMHKSKSFVTNMESNETLSPDFTIRDLTIGNLDDTIMHSQIDTSFDSAQTDNFNSNMLISDRRDGTYNKKDGAQKSGFSRSDTAFALNALLKNKSYAYLQDFFNGDYESCDDIGSKPETGLMTQIFDEEFSEFEDSTSDSVLRSKKQTKSSRLKREMTDYDIVYYQKLLNSSVNYLSSYTNDEEVY